MLFVQVYARILGRFQILDVSNFWIHKVMLPPFLVDIHIHVARWLVFCVMFCISLFVLWFTASDYPFCICDLRLLITPFVSVIYGFWLPLLYLWFTASDYPFCIFDLRLLITPFVLWFTASDYPFCIFKLFYILKKQVIIKRQCPIDGLSAGKFEYCPNCRIKWFWRSYWTNYTVAIPAKMA